MTSPGRLIVGHVQSESDARAISPNPFPVGEFVHLAVTSSAADGIRVYINGTQAFFADTSAPTPNNAPVVLANGPLGVFTGIPDEVQFYNRVLLTNEIAALVPMQ